MLTIVEAKRNWFPVVKHNKKTGQPVIDPDTGEQCVSMVPGGYRITLSDGNWVSVTKGKVKTGTIINEKNQEVDVFESVNKFSLNSPATPILDYAGQKIGENKQKQLFPADTWERFCKEYNRCGIPALVEQGMAQADEEMKQSRAA